MTELTQQKKISSIQITLLLVLVYFVVFLKIDTYPIRWWDESMFAVNTYEMMHNGNYFSLYYEGIPDLVNTKPPLTIWVQLVFVKLIGYNELAIRLPSAIAAAMTIIFLFVFMFKRFNPFMAWLSALILLTSPGFIGFHTARTGDSDSLLSLFLLLGNIYFLKYILDDNKRFIFLFFLFITLGFVTKMYAALLFIPAYLVILIKTKKLKEFLSNRFFLLGIVFFVTLSAGVLYLRELGTPGYLKEIFFKDAGRIFKVVEDHKQTWEFYTDFLILSRFSFWFIPFLIGVIFILMDKERIKTNIFQYMLFMIISYMIIISFSVTKLFWYDMPLYPYLAVISAYCLYVIFEKFHTPDFQGSKLIIISLILFSYPYWIMFRKSEANTMANGEKRNEIKEKFLFLKSLENKDVNGIKVYNTSWNGSLLFYKYKFADAGQKIEITKTADFKSGDKVLVSEDSLISVIKAKYNYTLLEKNNEAKLLQIQ